MTVIELVAHLRRLRFPVGSETLLQNAIDENLAAAGVLFEREVRLSVRDRIDFLVKGRIGIEVKARYSRRAIFRQLERYAAHEAIEALILITGTAIGLPAAISGKPIYHVSLGRASL